MDSLFAGVQNPSMENPIAEPSTHSDINAELTSQNPQTLSSHPVGPMSSMPMPLQEMAPYSRSNPLYQIPGHPMDDDTVGNNHMGHEEEIPGLIVLDRGCLDYAGSKNEIPLSSSGILLDWVMSW